MRKFILFLVCLIVSLSSPARKPDATEIKGRLMEKSGNPAFSCTVQLLKSSDSSFVKGDLSNEAGVFGFVGVPIGEYIIKISRVDLGLTFTDSFKLVENQLLDLGTISLNEKAKTLKDIEIVGRKPVFQRIEDKMVFNVSELASAVGSNAYEMLRKSPGVVIDRDSRIILKGKTGVRIQINGKPSPLSVADLAAFLQSIPATDIEAIEIIENPSSRYDASGKAGIINIRMKKDKNLGTNGSTNASVAFGKKYPKIEAGSRFNHRTKKLNVFAGYTNNTNQNWNYNNFLRTQNETQYDQKSESRDKTQGQFYRAGIDLFPSKNTTVGILYFGGYKESSTSNTSFTRIIDPKTGNWYQNLNAVNQSSSHKFIHNTNLNYEYKDTAGHQLNVDIDYDLYINNNRTFQPNQYQNRDGSLIRNSDFANHLPNQIDIKTARADYEQKLWKGKLGIGGKVSLIRTDNTFDFFNVRGSEYEKDPERSNQFVYLENVNAAYLNYSGSISKKWNFQAGIRLEQTNSEGDLTSQIEQNDQNVKRTYLDLFPSGTLNYEPSDKISWGLNYSRRIDRPGYHDLNPFEYKIDELTYQKGNAFLRPQYTHSVSLNNTLFQMVNQSASYNYTNDFTGQITDTIEGSRAFITQKNIASEQVMGYNISSPIGFAKWWSGYTNMGFNHLKYRANFGNGKTIDINVNTFNFYLQQNIQIKNWLSLELSGFYNSPSVWGGTFKNREFWSVDAGFKMKFMKDQLTANLTLTDLFYSQVWRGSNNFGGLSMTASGGWESRQVRIAMVYRYGNRNVKATRNRNVGAAAESKRVK